MTSTLNKEQTKNYRDSEGQKERYCLESQKEEYIFKKKKKEEYINDLEMER